jgi:retinoid hydroxylase
MFHLKFVVASQWAWIATGFVTISPTFRHLPVDVINIQPIQATPSASTPSDDSGGNNNNVPSPKLPPGRRTPRYISFLFDDSLRLLNPKTMSSYQTERANQYGDTFKTNIFGSPTIFVTSEEGLILLGKEEARTRSRAGTEACFPPHHQKLFGSKSILVQSGKVHEKLRRLIQPSLSPTIMETVYRPIVDQGLDDFLSGLKSVPTDEEGFFELVPELRSFFISIALQILMGKASKVPPGLAEDLTIWSRGLVSPPLTFIPWSAAAKAMRARQRIIDALSPLLQQQRQADQQGDSLLGRLVSAVDKETGEKLSDDDILDNVLTIIFAGSDTTASAAASLCMSLSLFPELQEYLQKNHQEVDRFVGTILQEYPPAPFGMRLVKENLSVQGFVIPKDWMVVYGLAGALASKKEGVDKAALWKSFLLKDKETMGPTSGSVAFGMGPRMCPGRYLATLELTSLCQKLTVANSVSWKLRKDQNMRQTYNPGFFPKDGLRIKLLFAD